MLANNAFLNLTSYEESEVLGRNCRFLQGAETDPVAVRQLRDAVGTQPNDKIACMLRISALIVKALRGTTKRCV